LLIRLAVSVMLASALVSDSSIAQQKALRDHLIGAWTLVAVVGERADGSKFAPFGPNPKGVVIFSNDGHFSLFQSSANVPKIAANDRAKATSEEATAIVRESIAYFGTYTISEAEKVLSVQLSGSTYANLIGGPE
jgi:lipocalin-like protein